MQSPRQWQNILESWWFRAALLALVTVIAYLPALKAGFIWDDDDHLTKNPCIIGPLGFKEIWASSHAYYYPLVLTTFWVLHKFVGLNPLPYHLLNVLLHASSAVLLWRVLRQLNVRGAWLGAALWALHPVMVQSVAWITELKNTQSCLFYLLSILFFLKFDAAANSKSRWWRFALSLLFFAMAITSKSSTVMLPVVLGLCLWFKGHSGSESGHLIRAWDLTALAPFFLISVAASGWTIWEQKVHSGAFGAEFSQTWLQRFAIAGRDIWFYVGKLLWPHPLIFIYPRSDAGLAVFPGIVPIVVAVTLLFFLWWRRNSFLRPVFFAAVYFVVSLFPVLGFFNVVFFRYSFVSDHFQYLASMGPLALIGSGIATALHSQKNAVRVVTMSAVLVPLGALTWRQAETYHDVETLWRTTIARNSECWLAHLNLGVILNEQGKKEQALTEYREALRLNPGNSDTLNSLGVWQVENGQIEEAMGSFRAALKLEPNYAFASFNLGNAFLAKGQLDDAIASYQDALRVDPDYADAHNNLAVALSQSGKLDEAVRHYKEALRFKPNNAATHNNLGVVLTQQGELDDAVEQFKEALRLDRQSAQTYINLARALAQLGRKEEAMQNLKEALRLKPDSVEAKELLRQLGADF